MRRILFVSALMIILVFSAAVLAKTLSQKSTTPEDPTTVVAAEQWEYLIVIGGTVNLSPSESSTMRKDRNEAFREFFPLETNMDKLGAKGWELVSVSGDPRNPTYYFKRHKQG
jgi:hypothetical protein